MRQDLGRTKSLTGLFSREWLFFFSLKDLKKIKNVRKGWDGEKKEAIRDSTRGCEGVKKKRGTGQKRNSDISVTHA